MTYENIGANIGKTVEEKQAAYGDSFGKSGAVMRILYPEGIPPEKMDDALAVVRVLDKLFRIATDRDALGESPWCDIAGYALLAVKRVEDLESTQTRVNCDVYGCKEFITYGPHDVGISFQWLCPKHLDVK
jgi:hypothetical protein